jgi:ABC-type transport system substrate-binding protein
MVLKEVDQELFFHLSELLGGEYFSSFEGGRFIEVFPDIFSSKTAEYARELLPATEHNPVIVFHLRPNVKFHDGHVFDAEDVRFTYQAIMNPKNLSPRIADYEPVKVVEVLDPLTVRIVYKRLYSPALGTWGMGILPGHLLNSEALLQEATRRGLDPEKFTLRQSEFSRRPLGCGPFRFREWKSDQYIVLDRFEDYWEGSPNYKRYTFRIVPDLLTQEMEFYAGTVDSYGVQPHQVERLSKDPTYQSFTGLPWEWPLTWIKSSNTCFMGKGNESPGLSSSRLTIITMPLRLCPMILKGLSGCWPRQDGKRGRRVGSRTMGNVSNLP